MWTTWGVAVVFFFYPSHPMSKAYPLLLNACNHCFVVIVEVVLLAMSISALATLDALDLSLLPPQISIYPLLHAPHGFGLDLYSIPVLDLVRCLGCPQFPPLLRFSDGFVLPTREFTILGR